MKKHKGAERVGEKTASKRGEKSRADMGAKKSDKLLAELRKKRETAAERARKAAQKLQRKTERDRLERERRAVRAATAERKRREREEINAEKQRLADIRFEQKQKLAAAKAERRKTVYARIRKATGNISAGFDGGELGVVPRVELCISGDAASVASGLMRGDIPFTDLKRAGGDTFLKIGKKDLRKAIAILNEMCYNYRISATYGLKRSLAFGVSRIGLLLGLAASVAALHIVYGYVWRVEIVGNDRLSVAAIESSLATVGLKPGCSKRELSELAAVTALGEMEGVADASCEVIGTTAYVRVLEADDYTRRDTYTSARAEFDAKVTRLVVRSGSPLVTRGDVVKRDDLLASGEVFDTAGELLYTERCDVDVYGEVSLTFSAELSPTAVEYRPTGEVAKRTVFTLFGLDMGGAESPFPSYETRSHTAQYDVLLPLYVTTYEYRETAPVTVTYDPDELAKSFAEDKLEELDFVGEFEYSYTVTQGVAGLYSVHLFVTGETLISRGV